MLCPLFFLPFLLTTGLNLLKLQTKSSCVFPQVCRILVKNNIPLCGKFYGYPHHQNRLGHMSKPPNESCETSVFLELVPPLCSNFYDSPCSVHQLLWFLLWFYTIPVYIFLAWSLLVLCPLFFLPFLLTTGLNLLKLQTKSSCVFPQVCRILVKNNIPLCGKFYGYPHHQNRLGHMSKPPNESCETSVFLELVPSQGRKSKNSNLNKFLSSCFKF